MANLTATDKRILSELQRDAGLTNVALAERIGISPSPCLRRVKQLEDDGYIKGYTALLDRRKIGIGLMAIVEVNVPQIAGRDIVAEFTQAVRAEPSIINCYITAGNYDFLLYVAARDLDAYSKLAQSVLLKLPGVQQLRSSFVLEAIKDSAGYPIL